MKITQQKRKDFIKSYDESIADITANLRLFKHAMLMEIDNHNFRNEFDMGDFAKEAFLSAVKSYYDENYDTEAAIQEAKDIVGGKK